MGQHQSLLLTNLISHSCQISVKRTWAGTGQPIKSIPSKGGSGKGNWGSDQEQIKQGMDSLNVTNANNAPSKRKEPDSFGDLNDSEASKPKQSWDEFNKAKGKKK